MHSKEEISGNYKYKFKLAKHLNVQNKSKDNLLINVNNNKNENLIKYSLISQYKDLMKIIFFDLGRVYMKYRLFMSKKIKILKLWYIKATKN